MTVLIVSIGGVGFILLLVFYWQALESGLNLEPLVKLNREVVDQFDVVECRSTRTVLNGGSGKDRQEDEYWLNVRIRPASGVNQPRELAERVLRHARSHYQGERGTLAGIRVHVLPANPSRDRVRFTVREKIGPGS